MTLPIIGCSPSRPFRHSVSESGSSTLHCLLNTFSTTSNYNVGSVDCEKAKLQSGTRASHVQKSALEACMREAETQQEWEYAARELDILEGNDAWQLSTDAEEAKDWNPERIKTEIERLDSARATHNLKLMVHLVRTALSRDLGGMGNINLYRHSYIGTKTLIEQYVDSAVQTIDAIAQASISDLPSDMTLQSLTRTIQQARQSFGRSALLLSGGATFGMAHIGVLKALHEADLLPRIISGASAGSIVGSIICTRTDAEIPQMLKDFAYGHLDVFEKADSNIGFIGHLQRLLFQGSWNDVANLDRVMKGMIGDMTFREAYNRSRRVLNVCLSSPSSHDMPRLLNYITSPNILIRTAVTASCSVPLVFNPGKLSVKNPMTGEIQVWEPGLQTWVDGSLDNDLPMERLSELFNVNHFIVSQVNPHVVPFLSSDDHLNPLQKAQPMPQASSSSSDWNYAVGSVAIMEAIHRLQVMVDVGVAPSYCSKVKSILTQKYSGDINILPQINPKDLTCLLTNPTVDFMLRSCLTGERATWPKISRIRERVAIEVALSRCLMALKTRVISMQGSLSRVPSLKVPRRVGWRSVSGSFIEAPLVGATPNMFNLSAHMDEKVGGVVEQVQAHNSSAYERPEFNTHASQSRSLSPVLCSTSRYPWSRSSYSNTGA